MLIFVTTKKRAKWLVTSCWPWARSHSFTSSSSPDPRPDLVLDTRQHRWRTCCWICAHLCQEGVAAYHHTKAASRKQVRGHGARSARNLTQECEKNPCRWITDDASFGFRKHYKSSPAENLPRAPSVSGENKCYSETVSRQLQSLWLPPLLSARVICLQESQSGTAAITVCPQHQYYWPKMIDNFRGLSEMPKACRSRTSTRLRMPGT